MRQRAAARFAAAAAALAMACAWAADPRPLEQPPVWTALSTAQRSALAPLQKDWSLIDGPRKQKWIEIADRFPALGEPERQRVQARMADWARMSPAERGAARLQFQELRQISPEDKQARWETYKALPDDERRALALRAKPVAKAASAPAASASLAKFDSAPKRNILPVPTAAQLPLKTVAPTVVQARPGATTTLLTTRQDAPVHQQPGLPKVAATPNFVNPQTMLPRLGPQGAAALNSAAASTPRSSP